jgi:hypothetical protein
MVAVRELGGGKKIQEKEIQHEKGNKRREEKKNTV